MIEKLFVTNGELITNGGLLLMGFVVNYSFCCYVKFITNGELWKQMQVTAYSPKGLLLLRFFKGYSVH